MTHHLLTHADFSSAEMTRWNSRRRAGPRDESKTTVLRRSVGRVELVDVVSVADRVERSGSVTREMSYEEKDRLT